MSDLRFRRQRLSRWADSATLDRLEGEFGELSDEDKAERNAFIDAHSDADIRALLDETTDDDRAAAKKASAKPRRTSRTPAPEPAAEPVVDDAGADASGGAEE